MCQFSLEPARTGCRRHRGHGAQPSGARQPANRLPRRGERRGAARSNRARIIYGLIASGKAYAESEALRIAPSS